MLFPTVDFLIFFLVVFFGAWLLYRRHDGRKLFLIAASYVFYAAWDWRFCFLLLGSSLFNYAAGLLMDRLHSPRRRKQVLIVAAAGNLAVLGFFKYFDFFVESLNDLFLNLGMDRELPYMAVILPVGISFFTFQGISYVVDVYRREIRASTSVLDILLYISFFPQLVAGPIVRASTLIPQIQREPDSRAILAGWGVVLILVGLFKKLIVANYLATELVDQVFFDPTYYGSWDLLVGAYAYAVQIYCDFSGYSDMAIGTAALLGYRFDKNFDQPFRAASIREFWRRWHISLSSWLRDYSTSRSAAAGTGRGRPGNLMITMLLGGIWHGAAWTFVVWGLMHGLALAVENLVTHRRQLAVRSVLLRGLGVLYTFHFVVLAFVFFRAESIDYAWQYLDALVGSVEPSMLATPFVVGLVLVGLAFHFVPPNGVERTGAALSRLPAAAIGAVAAIALVAIGAMAPEGVAPFIYFQF
ncbi:MAG: MBOAT family protein [Alphaproteobacteria bacterium]